MRLACMKCGSVGADWVGSVSWDASIGWSIDASIGRVLDRLMSQWRRLRRHRSAEAAAAPGGGCDGELAKAVARLCFGAVARA